MTSKKREKSLKNTKNTHSITSHSTPEPEDEVWSGLLLNVVVRESTTILQLLAGEDEPLLIRGNSFLVLDFSFNILDGIRRLNLQGNGLACQRLDKDLHPSPQPEHEVEGGLLLDVVIGKGPSVLQLLPREDESLLVWGNPLLVLDLGLDIFDGVGRLDFQGDGFSGQGLDEDLHTWVFSCRSESSNY